MKKRFAIGISVVVTMILFATPAFTEAQAPHIRIPVEVVSTTYDRAGERLVYHLKEAIRSSSSLELTFDQDKVRTVASIVTIDIYKNSKGAGNSTVYSFAFLGATPMLPNLFITHEVGYCSSDRLRECADGLVAIISNQADDWRKEYEKQKMEFEKFQKTLEELEKPQKKKK